MRQKSWPNVVRWMLRRTVRARPAFSIASATSGCASSTDCTDDIDTDPDDNAIVNNVAKGNGADPDETYKAFASDLAWDTTGDGNCWSFNTYDKSFPEELPSCTP